MTAVLVGAIILLRPHPEEYCEAMRLEGWGDLWFETPGFA